jgi:D-lactate dehydrogenase
MRVALFDTHSYDREAFDVSNADFHHEISFLETRLNAQTAALASGFPAVCAFVNDRLDASTLERLQQVGVRLIALRSAGYNHVDIEAAARLGLPVVRVPEYSPHAIAEHAVALMLALNRRLLRANARVHDWNFSLERLVGFDMFGKTVGILGTGRIGAVLSRVLLGFGCRILAYDRAPAPALAATSGVTYTSLAELLPQVDILSLHLPLTPETHHLIDARAFEQMRHGVMLINTGRGALVDSRALIDALKAGQVGAAGLDVYEEEEGVFFVDLSDKVLQDDVLARLMSFPNVLLTAHQAFLTREALHNIAQVTLGNISAFERGEPLKNAVQAEKAIRRQAPR